MESIIDTEDTIAAIALSSAVIVLWALFFVPEKSTVDQNIVEKEKKELTYKKKISYE